MRNKKEKVTNKERKINEKINCTYNTVIVLIVAEGKKFPQFSAPNCSAKSFFFFVDLIFDAFIW